MPGTLLALMISILIVGLILWLLNYLVDTMPMPPPFKHVAKVIIVVIGVIWLIYVLLSLLPGGDLKLG